MSGVTALPVSILVMSSLVSIPNGFLFPSPVINASFSALIKLSANLSANHELISIAESSINF